MRALSIFSLLLLASFSCICRANDFFQRGFILSELTRRNLTGSKFEDLFLSVLDVRHENNIFLKNTGEVAFSAPSFARSAYDGSVGYDLGSFYSAKNNRFRLIANKYLGEDGFLLSIGFDSGSYSEKLDINKSKFFGFSKSFSLDKNSFFMVSSGRWWGGELTERPCIDSYGRQYWCPNLISWIDRPSIAPVRTQYIDIRFQYYFY